MSQITEITPTGNALNILRKATDIQPLLEALSRGSILRNTIGRFVQCYAVIGGIAILLSLWASGFGLLKYATFLSGVGVFICLLVLPYVLYLCSKTIFIRGDQICKLPDSTFTISPIISILITLHGEVAFIFLSVMSIPLTILTWFGSSFAHSFFPVPAGGGFLAGIAVFIGCWVIGFLSYVLARWLQEWTMAIFSIAQNVDLMRIQSNTDNE